MRFLTLYMGIYKKVIPLTKIKFGLMSEYAFPAIIQEDIKKLNEIFGAQLFSKTAVLNAITAYVFGHKGKQLRPALVFLSARIIGEVTETTYSAAYMVELLHNATLIHDDVVDDAEKRRNLLSVKSVWKNKVAVLAGDYYLAKGLLFAMEHNEIKMLEIMSNAVREMSEGELKQIENAKTLENTEESYFDIIKNKTAALFRSSMIMGAYSSHAASDDDIAKISKIAEYLGIAFQIRDDALDYSKTNILGKAPLNDLQENKMTLPLIYALQQVSLAERTKIKWQMKTKHSDKAAMQAVADFVIAHGGITYVQEKSKSFCEQAKELCLTFPESESRKALIDLIDYVRISEV